jgi:hypothetical protein
MAMALAAMLPISAGRTRVVNASCDAPAVGEEQTEAAFQESGHGPDHSHAAFTPPPSVKAVTVSAGRSVRPKSFSGKRLAAGVPVL